MNKKGEVVFACTMLALGIGALALAAVPFKTSDFRVKKAIEKCEAVEPAGTDCVEFVAQVKENGGLSGTKPSYIRDI